MSSPTSPLLRPPARHGVLSNTSNTITRPRGLSNRTKQPSFTGNSPALATDAAAMISSVNEGQNRMARSNSVGSQKSNQASATSPRKRSSSIVSVQEVPISYDEQLDQETQRDLNTEWVNFKGAWMIHVLLIATGKILIDVIPGMTQTLSWTFTLQSYLIITFVIFHWVMGTPFSANQGAFDRLTFWEQIDHGAQNTPARKFLTSLPILLFLLTTHYARYDLHPALFILNFISLVFLALAPKLPSLHRIRFRFFETNADTSAFPSAANSAATSRNPSPQPSTTLAGRLTEANIKALDTSSANSNVRLSLNPPAPIQEESEPKTPVEASPKKPGSPTSRKWKFS